MKLVKLFNSKWWLAAPLPVFLIIAQAEGAAYWVAGVAFILWGYSLFFIKK